jgi:hypothetical protein
MLTLAIVELQYLPLCNSASTTRGKITWKL